MNVRLIHAQSGKCDDTYLLVDQLVLYLLSDRYHLSSPEIISSVPIEIIFRTSNLLEVQCHL
jgi:hypothetical protein